jgi:hypothetical protein
MSTINTLIADLEAIPLADMTERDQLTFAAAIGHLRRLSDRVHMLEISQHRTAEKIDELERENARLRAQFMLLMNRPEIIGASIDGLWEFARAALAGRGEK